MKTKSLCGLFLFIILCFFNAQTYANQKDDSSKAKVVKVNELNKREFLDKFIIAINKEFDFEIVKNFDKESIKEKFAKFLADQGYNNFFSSSFMTYVDFNSLTEEVQGFSMKAGSTQEIACDVDLDLKKAKSDFYGKLKCGSLGLKIGLKDKANAQSGDQFEVVHLDESSESTVR